MQLDSVVSPLPILASAEAVNYILPTTNISSADALAIRQGKKIEGVVETISALICDGTLVAIAEAAGSKSIKSLVVFNDEMPNV